MATPSNRHVFTSSRHRRSTHDKPQNLRRVLECTHYVCTKDCQVLAKDYQCSSSRVSVLESQRTYQNTFTKNYLRSGVDSSAFDGMRHKCGSSMKLNPAWRQHGTVSDVRHGCVRWWKYLTLEIRDCGWWTRCLRTVHLQPKQSNCCSS